MNEKIRERVAALTGPDRKVDAALERGFGLGIFAPIPDDAELGDIPHGPGYGSAIPRYTASLDAAIALVERVLPGWARGFEEGPLTCMAFVDPSDYETRFGSAAYVEKGPTPAIAMLLALLAALSGGKP